VKAFWHAAHRAHAPTFFLQRGLVKQYLETPARAEALLAACHELKLDIVEPPLGDRATLLTVHRPDCIAFLEQAPALWSALPDHGDDLVPTVHPAPEMLGNGARLPSSVVGQLGWYTADTSCPMTAGTWRAAEGAAACALAAADEAAAGRSAYALCRPPGHHAYPARAGGHCFLNNAALAAERLRARGAARVAILDIDAHHGNGTQGIFWDRADVVFVSVHGDPAEYYPFYLGYGDESGAAAGTGYTKNLPLPRGTEDAVWLDALRHGVDFVQNCAADALVVSLGFDASVSEPLRFLSISDDGFARAGEMVGGLGMPTALVQEGGYDVTALGRLLRRFLDGFFAPSRS
jgi:acetoin utilization deacetylase AcuC-like enzyme